MSCTNNVTTTTGKGKTETQSFERWSGSYVQRSIESCNYVFPGPYQTSAVVTYFNNDSLKIETNSVNANIIMFGKISNQNIVAFNQNQDSSFTFFKGSIEGNQLYLSGYDSSENCVVFKELTLSKN